MINFGKFVLCNFVFFYQTLAAALPIIWSPTCECPSKDFERSILNQETNLPHVFQGRSGIDTNDATK